MPALIRKRRVGLVKELAQVRREAEERLALERAETAAAKAQTKAMAGGWCVADGSETLNLDKFIIPDSSETIENSSRLVRRTASLRPIITNNEQFEQIHSLAYTRGKVCFRGILWFVDEISVDSIRERGFVTDHPTITINLTAIATR